MKKSRKLIAIPLAIVALAGGGVTAALWSDGADVPGTSITNGNLDLEAADSTLYDISPDANKTPRPITSETFRSVPGDTLRLESGIKAALEGDNILAKLDMTELDGKLNALGNRVHVKTFEIQTKDGKVISDGTDGDKVWMFAPEGSTLPEAANYIKLPKTIPAETGLKVVVEVTFDINTPDRELVQKELFNLSQTGVTLKQVRPTQAR